MTIRKQLMDVLAHEPRSVSSLARELGLSRGEVEDALRHMLRSARAAGHRVVVVPAPVVVAQPNAAIAPVGPACPAGYHLGPQGRR